MSPLMTPFAMRMLAGQYLLIGTALMMISILETILVPVLAGLLVNRYAHRFAAWVSRWLPGVSMWGNCTVIAITIALSRDDLMAVAAPLIGAATCHKTTGCALGYWSARVIGLNRIDSRTDSIEVSNASLRNGDRPGTRRAAGQRGCSALGRRGSLGRCRGGCTRFLLAPVAPTFPSVSLGLAGASP